MLCLTEVLFREHMWAYPRPKIHAVGRQVTVPLLLRRIIPDPTSCSRSGIWRLRMTGDGGGTKFPLVGPLRWSTGMKLCPSYTRGSTQEGPLHHPAEGLFKRSLYPGRKWSKIASLLHTHMYRHVSTQEWSMGTPVTRIRMPNNLPIINKCFSFLI